MVQLSHPYMTTRKTIDLTKWTFVGKIMSVLFNMPSRFVIALLPRIWFRSHLNGLVVFPTFFNLSLNLDIRNSWSEPQLTPSLGSSCLLRQPFSCFEFLFLGVGLDQHPLPATQDSTHGHHQMANTEIRLIIFFAARNGEALYNQQKQDRNLTMAQIMNSLLPNSDLNWRKWRKPLDHSDTA